MYCTVPAGTASCVNRPGTPAPVPIGGLITLKPGNRIEVLPAAVGRPFDRLTVTRSPSWTMRVGPGTCIELQEALVMAAGR